MNAFLDDLVSRFWTNPRILAYRQLAIQQQWRMKARRKFDKDPVVLMDFELFKGNRGKRMAPILIIPAPQLKGNFRIYDFHYFSDLGKKSTTVFEFHRQDFNLPYFRIFPKGMFSSVKELFVSTQLLFATTPEFNQQYEILAPNASAIKQSLNEDFLDLVGDEAGWTHEGKAEVLIAYQDQKTFEVAAIKDTLIQFEKRCERLINGKRVFDYD
ncbi:MAG: hypothetical protein AAFP19_21210 [Bacteroidota bacterium]